MTKKIWKQHTVQFFRGWGFPILAAVLIATSFKSAIADWNDVPTGSMIPTILIGDRVFINKLAYDLKIPYTTRHVARWADPKRGDVVVFYSPLDGTRLIKRVAGVPGDTITLHHKKLFINGTPASYDRLDHDAASELSDEHTPNTFVLNENLMGRQHLVMFNNSMSLLDSFGPVTVPSDTFFMLGDNRDNSADSRVFGFVERHLILGRATAIVLSRNDSLLNPRWDRFFQKLN